MAESSRNGNYEALAELFFCGVCTIPDGMGELIPSAEEASAIRRCGFDARPGRLFWCPALPDELLGGSPLLGHLSDAIDSGSRFAPWHSKRATALGAAQLDPLSKTDRLFLAALERAPDQRLRKTDLQRKLWRIPASMFHTILDRLVAEDRITPGDDWPYPLSRAEFEGQAARPRMGAAPAPALHTSMNDSNDLRWLRGFDVLKARSHSAGQDVLDVGHQIGADAVRGAVRNPAAF